MGIPSADRNALKARLVALLEPVIEDHGAVLVDLELAGASSSYIVRLLVHKDPGVTVQLCEQISLEVGDILEVEDPFPGRYRLEVTSPGLDRPLKTDQDFTRALSRLVKVVQSSGRTTYGRLQEWEADLIVLETPEGTAKIARSQIAKATIEAEF